QQPFSRSNFDDAKGCIPLERDERDHDGRHLVAPGHRALRGRAVARRVVLGPVRHDQDAALVEAAAAAAASRRFFSAAAGACAPPATVTMPQPRPASVLRHMMSPVAGLRRYNSPRLAAKRTPPS